MQDTATPDDWINWQHLEQRIPLDELPGFHRAFLSTIRPDEDWDNTFLRKIQGKFQATLKQLERDGSAVSKADGLYVLRRLIPDAYQQYL